MTLATVIVNNYRKPLVCLAMVSLLAIASLAPGQASLPKGFTHRGFYLHTGWSYKHPFAVRSWQRKDFAGMFRLLKAMEYDTVMIWPMLESIPMPLTAADAAAVREFRAVIDDAHASGLKCWLTFTANLTTVPEIAAKPWAARNPYPAFRTIHYDRAEEAQSYREHRTALIRILNNADGYVTIDGDPGGYAGAKPEDFIAVFQSDRKAIDQFGVDPPNQAVIPWIWAGWGTKGVWAEPIEPFVKATLQRLRSEMPEPWQLLPARSIRDGHANGRINIRLTEQLGLLDRSTLLCYETIEFEPSPPSGLLQFDEIQRILAEEAKFAGVCRGVFGNAQTPITVLPSLYYFGRGAADFAYLKTPHGKVLEDFAELLGGPPELLVPAWSCLQRELEELPADLPERLRRVTLTSNLANSIPGGSQKYVEILAAQVDVRRRVLMAIQTPPTSAVDAAAKLAAATTAIVDWWNLSGFIGGSENEPFNWAYIHGQIKKPLFDWRQRHVTNVDEVKPILLEQLIKHGTLGGEVARTVVEQLMTNR